MQSHPFSCTFMQIHANLQIHGNSRNSKQIHANLHQFVQVLASLCRFMQFMVINANEEILAKNLKYYMSNLKMYTNY
jgi:hypothetical protein